MRRDPFYEDGEDKDVNYQVGDRTLEGKKKKRHLEVR